MTNGVPIRHPLGLPAGSVRGVLSLLIVAQFWLVMLLPENMKVPLPINLYLLLTLVGLFLVSHGKSIATASDPHPSPLYLPGGTLRVVILGGTVAVLGYLYTNHPDRLMDRLKPDAAQVDYLPIVLAAYLGGFIAGYMLRIMPFRNNWMFQAIMAWVSFLAMGMLCIEIFIQAFINSKLPEKLDLLTWEAIITAVVACYFGTRS